MVSPSFLYKNDSIMYYSHVSTYVHVNKQIALKLEGDNLIYLILRTEKGYLMKRRRFLNGKKSCC